MKILVFSDSHGAMGKMVEAMEHERPHHVFFLGDHYRDGIELSELYPDIPMDIVRGNCDWGKGPDLRVVELEGVRFLLTHGHLQYVKSGLDELLQEAVEWCRERGVEFWAVNHDYPEETEANNPHFSRKLKADLFIDDRNLGGLPDWGTIYRMISRGKTWADLIAEAESGASAMGCGGSGRAGKKKRWWQF